MKIYNIYKKLGQTPLEALESLRKRKKISVGAKLTYAGRLDPMASGVLLILKNATQAQREKYMGLPKVYRAQILLGFSTDSFDLLGLPSACVAPVVAEGACKAVLKTFVGNISLPIPFYSSVIYKSKPLFEWARAGKLKEKDWLKREMEIKNIKFIGQKNISAKKLLQYIQTHIKKVKGDFRQEKILKAWKKILNRPKTKYQLLEIEVSCGSGTYVRSIANSLGEKLRTRAVLFSLERLSVGSFPIKKALV